MFESSVCYILTVTSKSCWQWKSS